MDILFAIADHWPDLQYASRILKAMAMTLDVPPLRDRIESLSAAPLVLPAFLHRAAGTVPSTPEGRHLAMIVDALEHWPEFTSGDLRSTWYASVRKLEAHADGATANGAALPYLADALGFKGLMMIVVNQVRDYTDIAELISESTPSAVIAALSMLDDNAESTDAYPLTTILVRRLGTVQPRKRATTDIVAATDPTADDWAGTIARCQEMAALMISSVAGDRASWTAEGVASAIDTGGLESWRSILTTIDDDPWGPVAQLLNKAIPDAKDAASATILRAALMSVRTRVEQAERQDVATRLCEYIASTGMTQRAFAARIGTSPSRLSTYASGQVTPSAAMMLRIAKVSAQLTSVSDQA